MGGALALGLAGAGLARALHPISRRVWSLQRPPPPLLTGALVLLATSAGPGGVDEVSTAVLSFTLVLLAVIDLQILRLPDILTLPLALLGVARALALHDDPGARLIGAAAGGLGLAALAFAYRRLRGRDGLGLGDAKLFGAAGAWLGWDALPEAMLLSCGLAFAGLAVLVLRSGPSVLRRPFPFGPALCAGFLAAWLWLR